MITPTGAASVWLALKAASLYRQLRHHHSSPAAIHRYQQWRRALIVLWWASRVRMWYSLGCVTMNCARWMLQSVKYLTPLLDVGQEMVYALVGVYPDSFWSRRRLEMKQTKTDAINNSLGSGWEVIREEPVTDTLPAFLRRQQQQPSYHSVKGQQQEVCASAPPPSPPPRVRQSHEIIIENNPQLAPLVQ